MTDKPLKHAQIHRFRDFVAISVRGRDAASTIYLTAGEARGIAQALTKAADDCDAVAFAASRLRTVEITPGAAPPPDDRAPARS